MICYIGTTDQLVGHLIDTDIGIILSRRQEFGGLAAIAIVRRTYIATQPRRLVRPVRAKKGEITGDHHYFRLCAFSYKPVYVWIDRLCVHRLWRATRFVPVVAMVSKHKKSVMTCTGHHSRARSH